MTSNTPFKKDDIVWIGDVSGFLHRYRSEWYGQPCIVVRDQTSSNVRVRCLHGRPDVSRSGHSSTDPVTIDAHNLTRTRITGPMPPNYIAPHMVDVLSNPFD